MIKLTKKINMQSTILIFCFLPIIILFIVIKISVLLLGVETESEYVRKESKKPHGPYLEDAYEDIDNEKEQFED